MEMNTKLILLNSIAKHSNSEEEYISTGKSLCNFGNTPSVKIPWLSNIEYESVNKSNKRQGLITKLAIKPYTQNLWNLVIHSMPPYFNKMYYNINIEKYVKNIDDNNYLALMSIFSLWNESFGIPILNVIHKQHKIYQNHMPNENSLNDWCEDCDKTTQYLRMPWEGFDINPYRDEDLCMNASEFLLEPCVLIQLPWKSTIYHQWLTGALSQILLFEYKTLEFKHLPINDDIVPITKSILNLVRQLKERIMLGFAILNNQVVKFPEKNNKYPKYIMDEIILPSIPTLEFLCDGSANKFIDILKLNMNNSNVSYIPQDYFNIHPCLAQLHSEFIYNFPIWGSKILPTLYPLVRGSIENIIEQINLEKNLEEPPPENISTKLLSLSEQTLLDLNEFDIIIPILTPQVVETKKVLEIIDKFIILKGKLPGVKFETVEKKFTIKKKTELIKQAIIQCTLYSKADDLLFPNLNDSISVASQIINLQLNIIKQEQLIRLTNTCRIMYNITSKKQKSIPSEILLEINTKLNNIKDRIKNNNRELFWLQFPSEWREPIKLVENKPQLSPEDEIESDEEYENIEDEEQKIERDFVGKLIPSLQNRIGRLLFHSSKNSFNLIEKLSISQPNLSFIHFIMPAIVVELYRDYQNMDFDDEPTMDYNFLEIIKGILDTLEKDYCTWNEKGIPNVMYDPNYDTYEENIGPKNEWLIMLLKIREYIRSYLGNKFIYTGEYDQYILAFDKIVNNLHDYGIHFNKDDIPSNFLTVLNDWFSACYRYSHILFRSSITGYKIPIPGNPIPKYDKLTEIYFTSAVLSELECAFGISKFYRKDDNDSEMAYETCIHTTFEGMKQLRFELLEHVITPDPECYEPDDLDNLIQKIMPRLVKSYRKLKEYRRKYKGVLFGMIPLLPFCNTQFITPKFILAINSFIHGKLSQLDKLLPLLQNNAWKRELRDESNKKTVSRKRKVIAVPKQKALVKHVKK